MSARDKLYAYAGTPSCLPVNMLDEALDAYRAEILAEAAAFVGNDDTCDCGGCATCVPRALAAGLLDMADGRMEEATAEAATATPFFQPRRTYTEPGDTTDWKFRCDSITAHPEDGERTALGWRHFRGEWEPYAYGEDDWEIHQIADHIAATEADE